MANVDPIAPVVQALSILVAPNPTLNTASPQSPATWTSGSNTAIDGTLYMPLQLLLGLLLGASSDLTSVGNGINSALSDVGNVVATIANQLDTLAAVQADAEQAFTALNTVLNLAQSVAPSSSTTVLQSAAGLFQQIQSLMSSLPSLSLAAAELGELSQQLTAAAPLFPAA
jgi:hypothetical protein